MDNYLNSFREMISLRGLTDHTLKNYCTYIRAYLDYLTGILHKLPEDVSWAELRDYIRWLKNPETFLTVRSTAPFPSCVFSHFMSSTNPGMTPSFLCVALMLICPLSLPGRKFPS